MDIETLKTTAIIISCLGFLFAIYQYLKSKPIYKFQMFNDIEINTDKTGTYLCARIHISNIGGKTGAFTGFIAIDNEGELSYPINTFIIDTEIHPEKTISGSIPIGHLIYKPLKALYMQDGVLKKRKIPNRMLQSTINELKNKKETYEKNNWQVHPTRAIKNA